MHMIRDYVAQTFNAQATFEFEETNAVLRVQGTRKADIKKWVNTKLIDYLSMQYPDFWENSLQQHSMEQ